MKNILIATVLIFVVLTSYGQTRLKEYTATNGITYHEKDTIKLGRGSAPNGDFLFFQMGGWGAALTYNSYAGSDQHNLNRHYSGGNVVLKKIMSYKLKGAVKVYFVVGGGNITNYNLHIEDAIASCEIANCNEPTPTVVTVAPAPDKFDQLKKLKGLLTEGIITQEEYDKEKAKLLEVN